jgi:putative membrane protein
MKKLLLAASVLACGFIQANGADKELRLPTDQKFVVKAVECAIAEVKFAETAIKRATNPEVKQFAQKLKEEHNQCLKTLMDQAAKYKLAVVEGLSKEHKEITDRLSKLEGKAFDQAYVRGVIERQEKAISSCEGQIKEGKVDEIKSFCKDAMPKIKEHLEAARKVQADIK